MLFRKISKEIEEHLKSGSDKILYMPVYFVMFVGDDKRKDEEEYVF